jgi:hypothetical protein
MKTFKQYVLENSSGYWSITANVPGAGKQTQNIAGNKNADNEEKRYMLGKFASRYRSQIRPNQIGIWVDKVENEAIFKWVPFLSKSKPPPEHLKYLEWPAMYG